MNDEELEDFLNLLKKIELGEGEGAFSPLPKNSENIKSWDDLLLKVEELPGDDPISWLPLKEKN